MTLFSWGKNNEHCRTTTTTATWRGRTASRPAAPGPLGITTASPLHAFGKADLTGGRPTIVNRNMIVFDNRILPRLRHKTSSIFETRDLSFLSPGRRAQSPSDGDLCASRGRPSSSWARTATPVIVHRAPGARDRSRLARRPHRESLSFPCAIRAIDDAQRCG